MKTNYTDLKIPVKLAGRLALIVVAVLLTVACASEQETPSPPPAAVVATPSATSTATATPAPPTHTATSSPTVTDTSSPTATQTPPPTTTATPSPTATPTPLPDLSSVGLDLEPVVEGLEQPVFATHAGDGSGRLFIVEKAGKILVLTADGLQAQPLLDITGRVGSNASEQGLLGLAFHPDFANNGRLFVYYTDRNGDTVISRFQANEERTLADPDSEVVLLQQSQPAGNHNGGMIAFGPDGYLYAGLGDGGGAGDRYGNGQNLGTILGTLIRIDVEGDEAVVPTDNPFVDQGDARPEIWAYGLRNPWRFSFDRATGDLWIADVGQNQWEEINRQPADSPGGENYGWPITEATHCYDADTCDRAGLTEPVAEYDHSQGCSVSGGYVYRGALQPALQGIYFYGDYCSGRVWGVTADANGQWQDTELLDSNAQISSFGETETGEVLLVDYNGAIFRLISR
ncbi:MAG: PQQ-dependent sugar dehydrogenase [Anaerolineae bacterium]|nr:PQQ-dependent sugar dehydrogenase [Anaerolineae bacterium]MCB0198823.1 PQQ-dependent sugar dehydrogenase [Anaerolineae bacterium]